MLRDCLLLGTEGNKGVSNHLMRSFFTSGEVQNVSGFWACRVSRNRVAARRRECWGLPHAVKVTWSAFQNPFAELKTI